MRLWQITVEVAYSIYFDLPTIAFYGFVFNFPGNKFYHQLKKQSRELGLIVIS